MLSIELPLQALLARVKKLTSRLASNPNLSLVEREKLETRVHSCEEEMVKYTSAQTNKLYPKVSNHLSIALPALVEIYARLQHPMTKQAVEDVLWEVNDQCDGVLSWEEYHSYFFRCQNDTTGLEPMDFYYLVSFLMYDKDVSGTLTMDEAMRMLYLKYGRYKMEEEMTMIFGQKLLDIRLKNLTFSQFYCALNNRREELMDQFMNDKKVYSND